MTEAVRVRIHEELLPDGGQLDVQARTVLEAIEAVCRARPVLASRLFDPGQGRYRALIHLNGEDVRFLRFLETPLAGGDELHIRPVEPAEPVSRSYYLTFGPQRVKEPVLHRLGRLFHVEVNILGARVTARKGFVHASLTGSPAEVERAIRWLSRNDVGIDEAD